VGALPARPRLRAHLQRPALTRRGPRRVRTRAGSGQVPAVQAGCRDR
jgi:hypothetical protein